MKLRPVTLLALTAILLGALVACAHTQRRDPLAELIAPIPQYGAAPLVRVKLSVPSVKDSITVDAGKAALRMDRDTREIEGPLTIARAPGGASVGEFGTAAFIEIAPGAHPQHFSVEGRIYRGLLRIHPAADGWEVINVIDLEQYVAGVVGWEMISSWPVEALKAQAVASRTYAVFVMEQARGEGRTWDLDDTTMFQVYGGVGPSAAPRQWRESANVLAARSQTTGQVLTYHGKGFKAFFHSTSGGHTTDPVVGLGLEATIEPLQGVKLGDFDRESPKHSWELRLTRSELTARLLKRRLCAATPIRIEPEHRAQSGHAVTVRIYGPTGHWQSANAIEVRQALGLPSTRFKAEASGDEWVFKGSGYGHGCGMCQWSARGMALQGWESTRILKAMYPGAELKTLY